VIARDRIAEERFAELLDRAERIAPPLSFGEVRELAHLYRVCSARLAIQRSRANDPEAVRYLNALCVRAYTHLRVTTPPDRRVRKFFFADFPITLAATARIQAIAALILLAGAIVGATIVAQKPAALYAFIPSWMYPADELEQFASSRQARIDFLSHTSMDAGTKSLFSAGLFVHNMQTGLMTFATGILAGVPTILLVFENGLILGAFAWLFSRDGTTLKFWAWMLPHAIPELLAVTLCAAGGLLLARAVIAPGRRTVGAALGEAVRPALQMVAASVPLFIVAAAIESFLRQSTLSMGARYTAAALAVAAITSYALFVRALVRRHPAIDLEWLLRAGSPDAPRGIDSKPER
jgi:uncharacterized membrane protein SpoIIM required for sporulation